MEFKGDKVARETQYFADPFVAPAWRAQWVERMETSSLVPGFFSGTMNVIDAGTGEVDSGPDKGKFIDLETGKISRRLIPAAYPVLICSHVSLVIFRRIGS
jgi:hypothetical protein